MECEEIFNIRIVAVETISRDFYWSSHSIDLDLFSKFLLKAFLPSNSRIDNVCLNAPQPTRVSDLFYQNHQNTQGSRDKTSEAHIYIKKGFLESINVLIKSDAKEASGRHTGIQVPLQLYLAMKIESRLLHKEKCCRQKKIFHY